MKHVRIWFSKTGTAKYISHLDLNRCMSRAVHKAKLPLWYTEGFHPHAFLTFALPLSLGAEGLRESMDIKMEEDLCPEEIRDRLNAALPPDIRVLDVTEPVMKPGQIAWASYLVELEPEEGESGESLAEKLQSLLGQTAILVEKRSKSGVKTVDIRPGIQEAEIEPAGECVRLRLILPAGSMENINPSLVVEALRADTGASCFARITRTGLYNAERIPFA